MGFIGNGIYATKQNKTLRERKSYYFKKKKSFELADKKIIHDLDSEKLKQIKTNKLKSLAIELTLYTLVIGSVVYYILKQWGF